MTRRLPRRLQMQVRDWVHGRAVHVGRDAEVEVGLWAGDVGAGVRLTERGWPLRLYELYRFLLNRGANQCPLISLGVFAIH
jgi:hypothetical protein